MSDLNSEEFKNLVSKPGVALLDVRTPAEYAEGHLENAQLIDFQAADFADQVSGLDHDGSYAIYCRSGKRSSGAIELMRSLGFKNLFNLTGGILEWQERGNKVVLK
jgi:rhodanese-related sulfurtransferase